MDDQNKINSFDTVEEIVIDFGRICRFCLTETDSNISIFEKCIMEESVELYQDTIRSFVRRLSQIKINNSQSFPIYVCKNCYELVKVCYNFSIVCQQSEVSLMDCYQRTLNETRAKLKKIQGDSNQMESLKNDVSVLHSSTKSENDASMFFTNSAEDRKWEPISSLKGSYNILKADIIKQKYHRIKSLSERLKEAQSKLAEDICRSNKIMLDIKKSNDLYNTVTDEKSLYTCPQCTLRCSSLDALKFHCITSHEHNRNLKTVYRCQCKKCNKNFAKVEKLKKHYKNVHNQLTVSANDLNYKVKKSFRMSGKKYYCFHCFPFKLFQTKELLTKHSEQDHSDLFKTSSSDAELISPPLKVGDTLQSENGNQFNCNNKKNVSISIIDNGNIKLFKVYICTDCSPFVSFASQSDCIQHNVEVHKVHPNDIQKKELPAVYVDSLNIFKSNKEKSLDFSFKVCCKNCDPPMRFTSTNLFVNHMYSNHDDSSLDNWDIESKQLLDEATGSKKEVQNWTCSECPTVYYRRQSLYYHMKEKHNKSPNLGKVKCPDCEETFCTNRKLLQHGISFHQKYFAHYHKVYKKKILDSYGEDDNRIKNFECDICRKKYVGKNSLKRHILKAHLGRGEVESVVCSYCGKTVSNKLNLKSHIEFVHEALFVSCPICKKRINFKTIGKHYDTHQTNLDITNSTNQFLCNLCGKILKSKKSFEDHQKLHKNIRDQLCDVCGSGFTTKKFLNLHKKTHQGIQRKVFNCTQCDKVFSGRQTLNRHLLTHSGEKNFICEICSKCFYTLQELNRHVRYHKKEYRFDCQLCEMRFLDKSRFRHHMMRHRNIRPHKCQFCDKMFIVRRKMNLHMAAKHNFDVQSTKAVWKDPKTYVPLDELL